MLLYVKKLYFGCNLRRATDRLRWARKSIGLTQTQLANIVKTTQQTIHDYEKNKRGSYADTNLLVNTSNTCGVTVD